MQSLQDKKRLLLGLHRPRLETTAIYLFIHSIIYTNSLDHCVEIKILKNADVTKRRGTLINNETSRLHILPII